MPKYDDPKAFLDKNVDLRNLNYFKNMFFAMKNEIFDRNLKNFNVVSQNSIPKCCPINGIPFHGSSLKVQLKRT